MCIRLRLIYVSPDEVIFDETSDGESLDALRESIRSNGLCDFPTVRSLPGGYRAIDGCRCLRCIRSLMDEDAWCFERWSRRFGTAAEIYQRIPAWHILVERNRPLGRRSQAESEHEMLTYVIVARKLRPPYDGLRLEEEIARIGDDLTDLFGTRRGTPCYKELCGKVARLSSEEINDLLTGPYRAAEQATANGFIECARFMLSKLIPA